MSITEVVVESRAMTEVVKDILAIIGGAFAIVASIYAFFRWGRDFLRRRLHPSKALIDIPKKTIIILQAINLDANHWSSGQILDKPAMMIVADFRVTNITHDGVQIVTTRLKKPKLYGMVTVGQNHRHSLNYQIASRETADVRAFFSVTPPFKQKGEPFVGDVALIDQFGNEHWEKKVHFRSAG
jgi:hypothetical protein